MKKRVHELDFIKGLAILLVVIGHTVSQVWDPDPAVYEDSPVFRIIYSFHMPLFVFVSGCVCSMTLRQNFRWLGRRLRKIGIPYLLGLILWYGVLGRSTPSEFLSPMAYWYLPFIMVTDSVYFFEKRFRLRGLLFGSVFLAAVGFWGLVPIQADLANHIADCLPFYAAGTLFPEAKKRLGRRALPIYAVSGAVFTALTPISGHGIGGQFRRFEELTGTSPAGAVKLGLVLVNKLMLPACGIGLVLLLTAVIYAIPAFSRFRRSFETLGNNTLFIYILHDIFFFRPTKDPIADCIISAAAGVAVPLIVSLGYRKVRRYIRKITSAVGYK